MLVAALIARGWSMAQGGLLAVRLALLNETKAFVAVRLSTNYVRSRSARGYASVRLATNYVRSAHV